MRTFPSSYAVLKVLINKIFAAIFIDFTENSFCRSLFSANVLKNGIFRLIFTACDFRCFLCVLLIEPCLARVTSSSVHIHNLANSII